VIVVGLLVSASLLAYGVIHGETTGVVGGSVSLLVVGLFALGVRHKVRGNAVALAREGDFLVGGELERPLSIADTTFEIVTDYEGSWVVVLCSGDAKIRLGAGGWTAAGERSVTKAAADRLLLALGLKRRCSIPVRDRSSPSADGGGVTRLP
jgi:hypothetical protein